MAYPQNLVNGVYVNPINSTKVVGGREVYAPIYPSKFDKDEELQNLVLENEPKTDGTLSVGKVGTLLQSIADSEKIQADDVAPTPPTPPTQTYYADDAAAVTAGFKTGDTYYKSATETAIVDGVN